MRTDWRDTLFAKRKLGIRFDLAYLGQVLDAMRPGLRARPPFVVAQVVGTNGKGSTSAMLAHGLRGRVEGRVGLFTSPHLHRVGERVRVDGRAVDDEAIRLGIERVAVAEADAGVSLSFFEILTAVALERFVDAGCSHVVLEAGLGGRLDATSVLPAALTLITRIGLDHQELLGPDIASIAAEKAAVIRPGVPVFSVEQRPAAAAVIAAFAAERGAPLHIVEPLARAPAGLPGAHQRHNAGLAWAGLEWLLAAGGGSPAELSPRYFDELRWPGRLELVDALIFDVAHNIDGVDALVAAMLALELRPHAIVFGTQIGKATAQMAARLRTLAPLWHVPPAGQGMTAADNEFGAQRAGERKFSGVDDPELLAAVAAARERGQKLLICGSHSLVGPLRAWALGLDPAGQDAPELSDPRVRG
ncbi:bifunctional folylpolyglutamate synthase/dihydrofolate synthase [Pseudenhygromyxa sp. WMMC2535]|uniref:bifunctional folylpolyglutamate synthase/dihydrofolate synthase n=1 Tax=Pseudenhygromyxa sp. WMMC2535 TaxID=2712867 RepID=UPI001556A42D|nr:bifunctional folylpolyglutamate synthase/dihydrofolate synthase [Pseudenhygromyxa sp. WMMC2535]NVB41828.1 bifunctional folylpolyglutamate synthase/dihydrofolate synthase [Pseudenhygromyxa sp. WMMC2535]